MLVYALFHFHFNGFHTFCSNVLQHNGYARKLPCWVYQAFKEIHFSF